MTKLYHYVHCPFCVRIRMALGYFNMSFESIVLPYNDEVTPVKLAGKKMLPIIDIDGWISNESLDIIEKLDTNNKLGSLSFNNTALCTELETLTNILGKDVHNLAMPYWALTPEFDDVSREYFIKKKSLKRGPFNELAKKKNDFIPNLQSSLKEIEYCISKFYKSDVLTIADIILASHIWAMYVVPEFQFST
ncbi:MAG: glutaredoxin 2, partial [Thermoproteota archaeon]